MNVVCGQCGTGYEFDDALVSDRGTTVRCTQCGFQFRVHSSRGPSNAPERWIVRKVSGEEYIFRSLSELQRAIGQRRVLINDSLSRDGATFRPLHQLSELDSFFAALAPSPAVAAQSAPSEPAKVQGKRPGDLSQKSIGAAAPPAAAWAPGQGLGASVAPKVSNTNAFSETTPRGGFVTNPAAPEVSGTSHGAQPKASPAVAGQPIVAAPFTAPDAVNLGTAVNSAHAAATPPSTLPSISSPVPVTTQPLPSSNSGVNAPLPYAPTLESERFSSSPPSDERPTPTGALPRRRRSLRASSEDEVPTNRGRLPSAPHLLESLTAPPQKRFGSPRWIVAVVLLGGSVLVAATVGRNYFASFRSQAAGSGAADPRIAGFLATGDEAFAAGDLEEARAQFEKASALFESADVMQRLLSVEVFRADTAWLQLKVLRTDSSERQPVEADFRERCVKIQARVLQLQKLSSGAPPSAAATLASIDALRVLGQVQAARALVERSSGLGDEPREAYVSAMLDVSEPNPAWDAVITRLKGAAAAERGVPRAQAALVYALISSQNFTQAQLELEVLRARKRQHPATPVLERYLTETQQVATHPSTTSEQGSVVAGTQPSPRVDGPEGAARPVDPMVEAAEARAAGELARAARLYTLALSQEPGNVVAMTGLGDVARSQGNSDIALSHYGAALRANPNHAPAILACADLKWSLGDRSGAVELYRRLNDGPPRVRERVLEFEKASGKPEQTEAIPTSTGPAFVTSGPSFGSGPSFSQPTEPPVQSTRAAAETTSPAPTVQGVEESRQAPAPVGPPPEIELK